MSRSSRTWAVELVSSLGIIVASACSGAIADPSSGLPPLTRENAGHSAVSAGRSAPVGGGAAGSGVTSCSGTGCDTTESTVATSAYPRLTHHQWALAAQSLLVLDSAPDVTGFTNDAPSSNGFDNNGGQLEVSPGLWTDYQDASEKLADEVASDSARVAKLLPQGLPASGDARAKGFVSAFGERAFRRPLSTAEVDLYTALFKQGTALVPGRDELAAGVQLSVAAMLQSPSFVYRIEGAGKVDPDGTTQLTDYELASRLSFMLWDSMPDAELFAAAKAGKLHEPAQLATQAERLLKDPRAAEKLVEFHRQLLELRRYDTLHPAGLPSAIGPALRQETERFVSDAVVDHDAPLATLFTASYSFVNRDIASLYGLTGSYGTDFVRADLDSSQRAGLLTQPGFLIYRSGDTAPILRGVLINLKLLCADLPPPPVFTPPKMTGTTRREKINSVTGKGTCGEGCHANLINPAGFPLEYFDDSGRYRNMDSGRPIDGTASYAFEEGAKSYDGPIAWSRALAESQQVHECYVRHWLEYGYGRKYAAGDAPLVRRVAAASLAQKLPVKQLLVQLVQSPSFRTRISEKP